MDILSEVSLMKVDIPSVRELFTRMLTELMALTSMIDFPLRGKLHRGIYAFMPDSIVI